MTYKLNRSVFHGTELYRPDDEISDNGTRLAEVCTEEELLDYTLRGILVKVAEPEQPELDLATPLPDDFPARELLIHGGYETVETVSEATNQELQEIKDIGPRTVEDIREALDGA